jgi:hypothetical protein
MIPPTTTMTPFASTPLATTIAIQTRTKTDHSKDNH